MDFSQLPQPVATTDFDAHRGRRDGVPWWLVVCGWIGFIATFVIFFQARKGLLAMLFDLASVWFILFLLLLAAQTFDWLRLQRLFKSLHRPSYEEDAAKLEAALKRRWMAPYRAVLLGLLGTIRAGHGRLPDALAIYGAALKALGRRDSSNLGETTALSVAHALAYAARCDEADQWATAFEQQVPKRACDTILARAVVAFHRGDYQRVLALAQPISASAGPREACALKAYALAQTGEVTQGRELASSLQPGRRAEFADVCFASVELRRFLMECGVEAAATEPV